MNKITPKKPLFKINNKEDLLVAQNHIQKTLKEKININFTKKRENKLKDLTCSLAGYNNGYQQLKEYWEVESPFKCSLFSEIVVSAVDLDADNFYLVQKDDFIEVYFRIKGKSILERKIPKDSFERISLIADLKSKTIELDSENNFENYIINLTVKNQKINLNILITDKDDFNVNLKNLTKMIPDIRNLGFSDISKLKMIINQNKGFILVGGTVSSGRETTISSIIQEVSSNLSEYGNKKILKIGEIRNKEDIIKGINLIKEGFLVLASIHTNSLYNSIIRLNLISEMDRDLSNYISGIIYQKLIMQNCNMCLGQGCIHCGLKGGIKRTLLSEIKIFPYNKKIKIESSNSNFEKDLILKYKKNEINEGEIMRLFGFNIKDKGGCNV